MNIDSLKILFVIHAYPPVHNAGAEWYAKNFADFLLKQGHLVKILTCFNDVVDGVEVIQKTQKNFHELVNWCDVIITHLGEANNCFNIKIRPIIFISHNSHRYPIDYGKNLYVIYNSFFNKNLLKYKSDSCVLRPPVFFERFEDVRKSDKKKYVTLINLNKNKGGDVLIKIAAKMPDVMFLGVEGGYDSQIKQDLKNIIYVRNNAKIEEYLCETKILLMPSGGESWGMAGVEAMMCGIPVLANKVPFFQGGLDGMKEAYGDAAIWLDRNKIEDWVSVIYNLLNNQKEYEYWSRKVLEQGARLSEFTRSDLFTANIFIKRVVEKFYSQGNVQQKNAEIEKDFYKKVILTKNVSFAGERPHKKGETVVVNKERYELLIKSNACIDVDE